MTRTKNSRKKSSIKKEIGRIPAPSYCSPKQQSGDLNAFLEKNYESADHFLKEFELFYGRKLNAHKKRYESACEHVKTVFAEAVEKLSKTYLNSTIPDQVEIKDLCPAAPKVRSSRARKLDAEPSEFKKPMTPRVNRSSSRKRSVSAPPPRAMSSRDRFKTPTTSGRQMTAITPKVANTPMCILRRPERGEVAFATTGSPLLVGRVSPDDIPMVTVPLQDGRIFSILPDPEGGTPCLPEFDEETKKYLRTLRQHLEMLTSSSP